MPESKDILIYHEEDRIAFIEINRPEKKKGRPNLTNKNGCVMVSL